MSEKSNVLKFMNQAELAKQLGVDRTTIGAWVKKGLPCIKGDQGKPHIFHFGCSLWWMLGKEFAEKRKITGLNAAQQIIFARAVADERDPGDDLAGESWMIPMLSQVGIGREDIIREIGFVRGLMSGLNHRVKSRNGAK